MPMPMPMPMPTPTPIYPSLLKNHRTIRGPAQIHLVAPIDRPLRRAPIVLREDGDHLSGFRFDQIGRPIAQVAQFPDDALDLIDAAARDRLLAQVDFLRPQCDPDALTAAETPQVIDHEVAARLGAAHDDVA